VGKGHGTFLVRFVISEALVGIAKFIVEKKEEIARELLVSCETRKSVERVQFSPFGARCESESQYSGHP